MKTAKVMMSCAKTVGMSEATAASWDPGLWLYPLMGTHEDIQGNISQEDILEDEEGSFYFTEFDCGCSFYVPSTGLTPVADIDPEPQHSSVDTN